MGQVVTSRRPKWHLLKPLEEPLLPFAAALASKGQGFGKGLDPPVCRNAPIIRKLGQVRSTHPTNPCTSISLLRGCHFFKALRGDGGTLEAVWTGIFLSSEPSFTLNFLGLSSGVLRGYFNPPLGPRMNLKARPQLVLASWRGLSPLPSLGYYSLQPQSPPPAPFVYSVRGLQGLCLIMLQ